MIFHIIHFFYNLLRKIFKKKRNMYKTIFIYKIIVSNKILLKNKLIKQNIYLIRCHSYNFNKFILLKTVI